MAETKLENITIICTNLDKLKCKGRLDGYTQPIPIGMKTFDTKCPYCEHSQKIDLTNYPDPTQPIFRVDK